MKNHRSGKLLLIGLLILAIGIPVHATTINDAKSTKKGLETKKANANDKIDDLEEEKAAVKSAIAKLDYQLADLDEKISTLNDKLDKKEKELDKTQTDLTEAKEKEKNQYATMKKRIKFMYENGESAYIDAIFEADSFADLLNRAEYVSQISEYDHNMFKRLEETRQNIADTEKKLEEDVEHVKTLKADVKEQQSDVKILMAKKDKQVKKYESSIKATKQEVAAYEQEIEDQEDLIARLEKEAAEKARKEAEERARQAAEAKRKAENSNSQSSNSNNKSEETPVSPKYTGGSFAWPCPSSYRITSQYGYRIHPITKTRKLHNGIDIGAGYGSSVVAAAGGTVILSQYSSSAGNWIIIDHGGGLSTVYMHNSRLLVSAGQQVSKGQHIANVGSTGMSTGAHLHFSVRVNGSYVNPMSYLQ